MSAVTKYSVSILLLMKQPTSLCARVAQNPVSKWILHVKYLHVSFEHISIRVVNRGNNENTNEVNEVKMIEF